MRTASHCYQETERKQEPNAHTHRAYLYVYSINSLCLFGCLGNEEVQKRFQGWDHWAAYIRHEIEMEEVQQQGNDSLPILHHTLTDAHTGTHTYTLEACNTACRHALRCECGCECVCVRLCADTPNEHLLVAWLKKNMEAEIHTREKDGSSVRGKGTKLIHSNVLFIFSAHKGWIYCIRWNVMEVISKKYISIQNKKRWITSHHQVQILLNEMKPCLWLIKHWFG